MKLLNSIKLTALVILGIPSGIRSFFLHELKDEFETRYKD